MRIHRVIKSILFKDIDPMLKGTDSFIEEYNELSVYTQDEVSAREICENSKSRYTWLLTYEFRPNNPLIITNITKTESGDFSILIGGKEIKRKELAHFASSRGHDCLVFNTEQVDSLVVILTTCAESQLGLVEAKLFTEVQEITNKLKKYKFTFDEPYFSIPLDKVKAFDHVLEK